MFEYYGNIYMYVYCPGVGAYEPLGPIFFFKITPQPLYNTIAGVQANFRVSYPICIITRVKCTDI